MTVEELKKELDSLGVKYTKDDKKPNLERKLVRAQKKAEREKENDAKEEATLSENKPEKELEVVAVKEVEVKVEVKKEKEVVVLPRFENKRVLKVMSSGHTKTHFHCKMEGGVSMHVPKRFFNK